MYDYISDDMLGKRNGYDGFFTNALGNTIIDGGDWTKL